jgi:hypothetical protein
MRSTIESSQNSAQEIVGITLVNVHLYHDIPTWQSDNKIKSSVSLILVTVYKTSSNQARLLDITMKQETPQTETRSRPFLT